jgi:hypothetical protein
VSAETTPARGSPLERMVRIAAAVGAGLIGVVVVPPIWFAAALAAGVEWQKHFEHGTGVVMLTFWVFGCGYTWAFLLEWWVGRSDPNVGLSDSL